MTHYEILGVKPDATPAQIQDGWRAAAKRFHPDTQKGASAKQKHDAAQSFLSAARARDVLLDPQRRAAYDAEQMGAHPSSVLDQFTEARGRAPTPRERTGLAWLTAAARLLKGR